MNHEILAKKTKIGLKVCIVNFINYSSIYFLITLQVVYFTTSIENG